MTDQRKDRQSGLWGMRAHLKWPGVNEVQADVVKAGVEQAWYRFGTGVPRANFVSQ